MAQSSCLADCGPNRVHLEYVQYIFIYMIIKLRSVPIKVKTGSKLNRDSMMEIKVIKRASKPYPQLVMIYYSNQTGPT